MSTSQTKVIYKPSLSSLPLQISLYYNSLFSFFFAIVIGSCSINKIFYWNKKVSISVLSVWAFIEPIRLYYGYSGNLNEKVPELATYLLISLFPTGPFLIYLAFLQPVIFPVDTFLSIIMLCFLVSFIYLDMLLLL